MTQRQYDINGWAEIKSNPISKAGIYPYLGASLGLTGEDANKIIRVLRPPEELNSKECIDSFKLIPWVDDHTMLGPNATEVSDSALPAEQKGVQGVIGENVRFENDTLIANIKMFSDKLASLVESGKKQLSAGYRCTYEMASGIWRGQAYDAVQRNIRGNHLALVKEGRMGPDVAVLDEFKFTIDAKDVYMEDLEVASKMSLEQVIARVEELAPEVARLTAAMAPILAAAEATEMAASGQTADGIEPKQPNEEQNMEPKAEEKPALDHAEIEQRVMKQIADKAKLVDKLSTAVGVFDHADMTLDAVVQYGCDKLGVQNADELNGYLKAKATILPPAVAAQDAAPKRGADFINKYLSGE